MNKTIAVLAASVALTIAGCATTPQSEPADAAAVSSDALLDTLAERMVAEQVGYDPTFAYHLGISAPDHRRWPDRRPAALAAFERQQDALLAELGRIEPTRLSPQKRVTFAGMVERLEAGRGQRVCRFELWDVNHMGGWHLGLADVARDQPVATAEERAQALERWEAVPAMIEQEIANLRLGLEQGYSAPKAVVARVIRQVDGLVSAEPESLPF